MKRVVIVQARMTSTRLPGKVLTDLAGKPMLAQQLQRLGRARNVDEIVIATTQNQTDDPIIALSRAEGVRWFRGSEGDVLSRYVGAAREARAELVVRITADCPLLEPAIVDRVIAEAVSNSARCDYASNVIQRTFPQGLDAEALFYDSLERVNRMAHSSAGREHVTYFMYKERPDLFQLTSVMDEVDNSDLRWTVDTTTDLTMVRRVYHDLGLGERFLPYETILNYVRANPEVAAMNLPPDGPQV